MDSITQYFQLAARRPELFAPSDQIPLCMDEETLRNYSASTGQTGRGRLRQLALLLCPG